MQQWNEQRVAEGELGCPICHARYPIHRGVADFSNGTLGVRQATEQQAVDVMRLAAQLALVDGRGIVLLTGRYAGVHKALLDLVDVTCLLVDVEEEAHDGVVLRTSEQLPLVDHALRGAAVDAHGVRLLPELARCVRAGGRIVAPATSPRPINVRLLAEDSIEWVGEVASEPTIQLRRAAHA